MLRGSGWDAVQQAAGPLEGWARAKQGDVGQCSGGDGTAVQRREPTAADGGEGQGETGKGDSEGRSRGQDSEKSTVRYLA